MKKQKKKNFIAIIIFLILSFLIIYSGIQIINWAREDNKIKKQVKDIDIDNVVIEIEDTEETEIINQPEKKESPYWKYIKMNMLDVDFNELTKKNSDTIGWLKVNGTSINYPVVQTDNNDFYLKHDFNKNKNGAGWIFADFRNTFDTENKNTIIYGHGRINTVMFGSLKNILESTWYDHLDNHVIKFSTLKTNSLWQVFSVYHIEETNDYIKTNFSNDNEFNEFINMLQNRSMVKFDTEVNSKDKILTLSTCYTSTERVVMHAKLIKKSNK